MYEVGGYEMIFGVLLSLGFIALGVWYFNKMIDSGLNQKAWLTRFIALLLAAMLGLFMVDKLVSFGTPLLTEEMSNSLFELIKNIVLVVFGYQFNDKTQ
jgi:uncharacterized membrane protein